MKVEYINPFIEASQSVIIDDDRQQARTREVYLRKSPFESENVVVIVGLTGAIRGQVVIAFTKESAIKIASAMMGGMPVTELDEMSKSDS